LSPVALLAWSQRIVPTALARLEPANGPFEGARTQARDSNRSDATTPG
jgi:hypothetical protein